jgi:hypothetical protein
MLGEGCKKDEPLLTDPVKAILGKWIIIEMGGEPVEEPSGYKEYLPDSVLLEYDYVTGEIGFVKKYWIDSLLHEGIYREDGFLLTFEYRYLFYDDKLKLEYSNLIAMYNTFVYKKIK